MNKKELKDNIKFYRGLLVGSLGSTALYGSATCMVHSEIAKGNILNTSSILVPTALGISGLFTLGLLSLSVFAGKELINNINDSNNYDNNMRLIKKNKYRPKK